MKNTTLLLIFISLFIIKVVAQDDADTFQKGLGVYPSVSRNVHSFQISPYYFISVRKSSTLIGVNYWQSTTSNAYTLGIFIGKKIFFFTPEKRLNIHLPVHLYAETSEGLRYPFSSKYSEYRGSVGLKTGLGLSGRVSSRINLGIESQIRAGQDYWRERIPIRYSGYEMVDDVHIAVRYCLLNFFFEYKLGQKEGKKIQKE